MVPTSTARVTANWTINVLIGQGPISEFTCPAVAKCVVTKKHQ
jgi:hypothetical protein